MPTGAGITTSVYPKTGCLAIIRVDHAGIIHAVSYPYPV